MAVDSIKAVKEKLEIVLSAPVQGEAGGRGVWGEFRPPSPESSVRIFSNRHRQIERLSERPSLLRRERSNYFNMEHDITYEKILLDIRNQNYVEIPLSTSPEDLNKAAQNFIAFLELPQELKNTFTVIADPNDRGSDSGYALRKKETGRSDNKEYFNYRGITEILLHNQIESNNGNLAVDNFFRSARNIYVQAKRTLEGVIKIIDAHHPGVYHKVFLENPDRLLCLRFVKYDSAGIGDFLAKAHYDRGFCALALAESSPGLRVGKDDASLKEIIRHGSSAIFMPAFTFNRDVNSDQFTPAWHDVVQKAGYALNDKVARWAMILFSDIHSDNSISYEDTHTSKAVDN